MQTLARALSISAAAVVLSMTAAASAQVTFDWVTVGDPWNTCDPQPQGCLGSVPASYRISKYPVTNAQYADFLNAVATADPNALYNSNMGSGFGGITQSGSSGSFSYSLIAGRQDMPVNWVSFWDATRFANWLHNDQPTGAQDDTTTENGAYLLTEIGMAADNAPRQAGARALVPTEDEWFKAAYYDANTSSYFDYPVGTDTPTACVLPGATPNTANCTFVVSDLTAVGSYTASASPSGTFGQGGNVWEWNQAKYSGGRGLRGGAFNLVPGLFAASYRNVGLSTHEETNVGFRIASPSAAPEVPALNPIAVTALGTLLLMAGSLRRVRSP